ncbi:5-oxoprolinase subunit PxpB [Azospirillum rugosum]|uniref:KipI family sensor histidine kinase inhibitor n=1 Tax=Azospirillum rugosum TaxID=416170 RepID=A0ABS4SMJ8_9PROT|nr:5-oxoprolinase subunit PxpB [Azospirillum rugosum]MBP2293712.1 KipI family sensor histidine kinase inhibitor [Azospirillum rugosum]MDQ0527257.1 KipI family sensor histidine kinase inhibitor [Azospirillum rugosum]
MSVIPLPASGRTPVLRAAGDSALIVELGDGIAPALNAAVHRLDRRIAESGLPGIVETVPTYRSILVQFDPAVTGLEPLGQTLLDLAAGLDTAAAEPQRRWIVPVCFGGAHGEDLDEVARRSDRTTAEVIDLHCSADYRVYMLGFSPGFAYLGGLPEALHQPRRENPRMATPAGSVMQGGAQAAISPIVMPSGWHLLGRTPARTFDLRRDPPFLLAPGDRVRFTAISPAEFNRLEALPGFVPPSETVPAAGKEVAA